MVNFNILLPTSHGHTDKRKTDASNGVFEGLGAIHYAAMLGRVDMLKLLLPYELTLRTKLAAQIRAPGFSDSGSIQLAPGSNCLMFALLAKQKLCCDCIFEFLEANPQQANLFVCKPNDYRMTTLAVACLCQSESATHVISSKLFQKELLMVKTGDFTVPMLGAYYCRLGVCKMLRQQLFEQVDVAPMNVQPVEPKVQQIVGEQLEQVDEIAAIQPGEEQRLEAKIGEQQAQVANPQVIAEAVKQQNLFLKQQQDIVEVILGLDQSGMNILEVVADAAIRDPKRHNFTEQDRDEVIAIIIELAHEAVRVATQSKKLKKALKAFLKGKSEKEAFKVVEGGQEEEVVEKVEEAKIEKAQVNVVKIPENPEVGVIEATIEKEEEKVTQAVKEEKHVVEAPIMKITENEKPEMHEVEKPKLEVAVGFETINK